MATAPQTPPQLPVLPPITWTPFVNEQGILTPAALNILQQLWAAAFGQGLRLLGYAKSVNFNVAGDTPVSLSLPTGAVGWRASLGLVWGTQGSFSTTKAGIYSAPFAQGATLVGQTGLSGITATGLNAASATAGVTPNNSAVWSYTTVYFNVATAQGGAALGNFYLYGYPVF